jgi:hypothetical protein
MSVPIQMLLQGLADVPGVEGSFVADPQGTLLHRRMNDVYSDGILEGAASRATLLFGALEESGLQEDEVALGFQGFTVMARKTAHHMLLVLARPDTNFEALRVASGLLLRQLRSAGPAASVDRTARREPEPARREPEPARRGPDPAAAPDWFYESSHAPAPGSRRPRIEDAPSDAGNPWRSSRPGGRPSSPNSGNPGAPRTSHPSTGSPRRKRRRRGGGGIWG